MSLTQEELVQTLLAERPKFLALAWAMLRDVHDAEDVFTSFSLKQNILPATLERDLSAQKMTIPWRNRRKNLPFASDAPSSQRMISHPGSTSLSFSTPAAVTFDTPNRKRKKQILRKTSSISLCSSTSRKSAEPLRRNYAFIPSV